MNLSDKSISVVLLSAFKVTIKQYWALTKPRVTCLAVFCAIIGMCLSTPILPNWQSILLASIGIWLLAGASFTINCLLERHSDSKMKRTAWRASATGGINPKHIALFACIIAMIGFIVLNTYINPLTAWLTVATFIGYAFIYTLLLKPNTPQNIVIGGLSGAMPPALGWAAMTNSVPEQAWLLVLIIFIWTPPHFWALALYRVNDYIASGLPMLPITHGNQLTRLHILLYTVALSVSTVLPYIIHMSGILYLSIAVVLNIEFLRRAYQLWHTYSDNKSRSLFKYSNLYLILLFTALLVDHYIQ